MKRYILSAAMLAACATQSFGIGIFDNLRYQARLGYNIGGTAPVGMPAEIRSLDKFKPKANLLLGLDTYKPLSGKWGIMAGFHYENKGMETDARVKNYHMEMRYGDQVIAGMFTGNVVTKVEEWMVTMPLQATYDVSRRVRLKAGPYFSYVMSNDFSGYAYDGYLREGDPTGQKVELGHDEGERGDYDFTDHLRHWQFGVDVGADWYFSKHLGAYADLSWGLSAVFEKDFKTIEQKMYPIFGSVGLIYKLK